MELEGMAKVWKTNVMMNSTVASSPAIEARNSTRLFRLLAGGISSGDDFRFSVIPARGFSFFLLQHVFPSPEISFRR